MIDGTDLVIMLKELELGIEVRQVEEVQVNSDWFAGL
jgi:hypothetical protein